MIDRADTFIRSLGVEAYRVGGSVRDEILGRRPKDGDYMVRGESLSTLAQQLGHSARKLDPRSAVKPLQLRGNGEQIGWRVSAKPFGMIEIALPRTEVSTGPGRHDFKMIVDPDLSLEDDAHRRDFTFNALYKIVHDGRSALAVAPDGTLIENIIDPLGGMGDLYHKTIRTTNSGSFRDDPLRILRALRFVSRLGYDLSHDTYAQMSSYSSAVHGLTFGGHASGTVMDELEKILMGEDVRKALRIARDTMVLGTLLPELAPMLGYAQESRYHDLTVDEHTFAALHTAARIDAPPRVRFALLFHDAGKPAAAWTGEDGRKHYYAKDGTEDHEVVSERLWRAAAVRLGATKARRDDVAVLVRNHMVGTTGKFKPSRVRQLRVKFGDQMLRDLLIHRACDISGKSGKATNQLQRVADMEAARVDAYVDGVPASVRDLQIDGHDAAEAGLDGREIGEALKRILHDVVSQPNEQTLSREWQLGRLK